MFTVEQYRRVQSALGLFNHGNAQRSAVEAIGQHREVLREVHQAVSSTVSKWTAHSPSAQDLVVLRPQNHMPIGGYLFRFESYLHSADEIGYHLILQKDVEVFEALRFCFPPQASFTDNVPMILSLHYYMSGDREIKTRKYSHGFELMGPKYAENRSDYPYIDTSVLGSLDQRIGARFGGRIEQRCAELKIEWWGEFVQKTEPELLKPGYVSTQTLKTVKEILSYHGLTLGMKIDPTWTPPDRRFGRGWGGTPMFS